MQEIKCPKCGEVFTIDEKGYAAIVSQIKNEEFTKELKERIELMEEKFKAEQEKAKEELNRKEQEIIALKEKHKNDLRETVEYYKELKIRLSTKMVGETLEQHCLSEFNKIRTAAFPKAFFDKDNDAKSGSKGDFIFRDFTDSGEEFISIMFEMKNEMETTAKKHKNEDFLKELDKDRNEKNCEYAVLVSMLESDNEFYNTGIVDVSYKYPKMYVIRPQFFISMITLLRNAAFNTVNYKKELAEYKQKNIDITNFEDRLNDFKDGFQTNYGRAGKNFKEAIEKIDTTIKNLEDIKENLRKTENNLRLANNKLQDLTVKKLTKDNSTMIEKFKEVENKKKEN